MSRKLKILIVEDEPNLGETLKDFLTHKGHLCELVNTCQRAKEKYLEFRPNAICLDIGLPDGNGLELAEWFNQTRKNCLLLFISAQHDPETRLKGLEIGAEDFITKPFELGELSLKLDRWALGLKLDEDPSSISLAGLRLWHKRYQLELTSGEIIELGQKECEILKLLLDHKTAVVSRDEIIDKIWGENNFPTNRTVDNYIVKLRKIIDRDAETPVEIKSIRGIGYQLKEKGKKPYVV